MELHLVGLCLSVVRLPFFLSVAFRLTVTSFVFSFVFSIRSLSFLSLFLRFFGCRIRSRRFDVVGSSSGVPEPLLVFFFVSLSLFFVPPFFSVSLFLCTVSLFSFFVSSFVLMAPPWLYCLCLFLSFFASFLSLSALTSFFLLFTVPRPSN